MKYFEKGFIQFYSDLGNNNNKEWFHSNKKRYETYVKAPMQNFVSDVLVELRKIDADINNEAKKCIGRINRDIRFSNDKTPYKLRSFAHITKGDKSDPIPVIAFQMGAYDIGIMSGFYNPSKERLKAIRENILENTKEFQRLYLEKDFKEKYNEIKGEGMKRIPAEYKGCFKFEPLIANKQFYYVKEFTNDILLTDEILPVIIEFYKAAKPLNDFLSKE